MATFGKTTIGETIAPANADEVRGSVYSCPGAGTLDKITVYVDPTAAGAFKCLLHKHSDLSHVATSDEVVFGGGEAAGWVDFACGSEALTAQNYVISLFTDAAINTYRYNNTGVNSYLYQAAVYPNVPNPLVPAGTLNHEKSIYCTYTPAAVGGAKTKTELTLLL